MPKRSTPIRTRYTSRQRQAVADAQTVHGLGPKAAAELLNRGQLEDSQGPIPAPLPPMPATTAADLARRARRRAEREETPKLVTESPAAARATICRRAVALVDRELSRLERRTARPKPAELREILKLAREADALLATQPGGKPEPPPPEPPTPPETPTDPPPEEETLEQRIAREESARRRSEAARRPQSPTPTSDPAPVQVHNARATHVRGEEGQGRQLEGESVDRGGSRGTQTPERADPTSTHAAAP
jgi:hypothetical protein